MKALKTGILVINRGSSSIKFALYNSDKKLKSILSGQIKRIGLDNPEFTVNDNLTHEKSIIKIDATTFKGATEVLMEWLKAQEYF